MKAKIVLSVAMLIIAPRASYAEPYTVKLRHPICEDTYITEINARIGYEENNKFVYGDPKEVGSAVTYANGEIGVSYDYVPALSEDAHVGDKVRLCKVAKPVHCPKGDDRGQIYRAFDYRTGKSWTLMNSGHGCGGA